MAWLFSLFSRQRLSLTADAVQDGPHLCPSLWIGSTRFLRLGEASGEPVDAHLGLQKMQGPPCGGRGALVLTASSLTWCGGCVVRGRIGGLLVLLRYVPRFARRALSPLVPTLDHKLYMLKKARHHNAGRPLVDVFSDIYARNLWGGRSGDFYSGPGSDDAGGLFTSTVTKFVEERGVRSIVDCGCGDFRIGKKLALPGIKYIGVDVVPGLIARNQAKFGSDDVSFLCRDLTTDDLPGGDLCIIREVLQHLSNDQINRILPKLSSFRFALIAEGHPPRRRFRMANLDKPAGDDVRLHFGSGVYLDRPPFSLPDISILAQLPLTLPDRRELLTIYLVERAPAQLSP
jgi:methyltransferase family protein